MRSQHSFIVVLAASAAIAVSTPVATGSAAAAAPAPASTSTSTDVRLQGDCTLGFCGNVHNRDDRYSLLITNDWGKRYDRSTWRTLRPGQNGRSVGVKDVDGYWVGTGCKVKRARGWIGPGWHKVRDVQNINILDIRC
ncbi:hypothetical protein ACFQ0X_06640 [Streptomyces rectiviolaceus]|uniref:Secreted protein n=1 Tax=Streptomyces rectiviolaceus TaxID=332591 RepID=A0ABP6NJB3_9ACTN